jgi:hypothetical protein
MEISWHGLGNRTGASWMGRGVLFWLRETSRYKRVFWRRQALANLTDDDGARGVDLISECSIHSPFRAQNPDRTPSRRVMAGVSSNW